MHRLDALARPPEIDAEAALHAQPASALTFPGYVAVARVLVPAS